MKLLAVSLFLFPSIFGIAQCDNIETKTDRFENTRTQKTTDWLTFENSGYKFTIYLKKYHSTIELVCYCVDSEGKELKIGQNGGVHFLFSNGSSLKLGNDCLRAFEDDPVQSNQMGCISIKISTSGYNKYDTNTLEKLSLNSINAIRFMDIGFGSSIDFDLTKNQQNFIKDAINCMK